MNTDERRLELDELTEKVVSCAFAVSNTDEMQVARCLNCLKATGLSVCLLLNFEKLKVKVKRVGMIYKMKLWTFICVHPRSSAVV